MNKIVGSMSKRKVMIVLVSFCVISGGLSIYFFIDAIVSKPKARFKIEQVRVPQLFDRSGDEVMEGAMPGDIYQEIQ